MLPGGDALSQLRGLFDYDLFMDLRELPTQSHLTGGKRLSYGPQGICDPVGALIEDEGGIQAC